MNGTPLALGVAAGLMLASALTRKPAGSRDRGIDRARIRELGDKLRAYTRSIIEEVEGDPDAAEFDPNEYSVYKDDLERALGVPVLGWGDSRVVVRVAPGIVAKLPWREDGFERNAAEVQLYEQASDEVKEMLLPPLDYIDPPGVSVFPEAKHFAFADPEDLRKRRWEWDDARNRWLALVKSGKPGAVATDVWSSSNFGFYNGKLVLIDYEPEGGFNRVAKNRTKRRR
jgi:hypothetical protein